jgi:hypothetical protein
MVVWRAQDNWSKHMKILSAYVVSAPLAGGFQALSARAAGQPFDGIGVKPFRLSTGNTRSIWPENFAGGKGKAGMATDGTVKNAAGELGQGWKVSPAVAIKAKTTFTLAEIEGPGATAHIWKTPATVE